MGRVSKLSKFGQPKFTFFHFGVFGAASSGSVSNQTDDVIIQISTDADDSIIYEETNKTDVRV